MCRYRFPGEDQLVLEAITQRLMEQLLYNFFVVQTMMLPQ